MDANVLVAAIAAIAATASGVGSFIASSVSAHRARAYRLEERAADKADRLEERAADLARQDDVRAQAAETAALLLKTQKDGIRRTEEVARVAAIATNEMHGQLRQIRAFVNSDLTKVLQADLDQTRVTLLVLRKLVGGTEYMPSQEDVSLIRTTESRIEELEKILNQRVRQHSEVDAEVAKEAKEAKEGV